MVGYYYLAASCGFYEKHFITAYEVGMHHFLPYLQYLPIESLAMRATLNTLNKGLGLTSMSFPDIDEDAAAMGANAVYA